MLRPSEIESNCNTLANDQIRHELGLRGNRWNAELDFETQSRSTHIYR